MLKKKVDVQDAVVAVSIMESSMQVAHYTKLFILHTMISFIQRCSHTRSVALSVGLFSRYLLNILVPYHRTNNYIRLVAKMLSKFTSYEMHHFLVNNSLA